jgi:hypothetical protein
MRSLFRTPCCRPVSEVEHNVPVEARERRRQLRAAVFTSNGPAIAELLRQAPWPEHALQLIGDGLLAAVGQRVDGAERLVRECVTALCERDWEGDQELTDALDAQLGGPAPLLRPLPVDLDELSSVLEGDPVHGGGRIDLSTGDVWPQPAFEYEVEVGDEDEDEDEQRWLWVTSKGSRAGYRDMERFIGSLDDLHVTEQLERALVGRGPFRRFKDRLARWPELSDQWYAFSEDRHRGRARAWLAAEGYTPVARGRRPGTSLS